SGGGGASWSLLGRQTLGANRVVEIWSSKDPAVGTGDITATWGLGLPTSSDAFLAIYSFANVEINTPVLNFTSSSNASTITVTTNRYAIALIAGTTFLGVPSGCTTFN